MYTSFWLNISIQLFQFKKFKFIKVKHNIFISFQNKRIPYTTASISSFIKTNYNDYYPDSEQKGLPRQQQQK